MREGMPLFHGPCWWGLTLEKGPTEKRKGNGHCRFMWAPWAVKYGRRVGLPADPSAPPGPLTHLNLLDSSEVRLQSEADGRSLPGSWTR
jgi:hypothetical protein